MLQLKAPTVICSINVIEGVLDAVQTGHCGKGKMGHPPVMKLFSSSSSSSCLNNKANKTRGGFGYIPPIESRKGKSFSNTLIHNTLTIEEDYYRSCTEYKQTKSVTALHI